MTTEHARTSVGAAARNRGEMGERPAARGSMALLVSFFAVAVLNYAFAIAMGHLLPVVEYGVLGVVQSLLLIGSMVVGSGFPWALTNIIARGARAERAVAALSGALFANLALSVLLAVMVIGLGPVGVLPISAASGLILPIAAAALVLLALRTVLSGALAGLMRLELLSVIGVLEVVVKVVTGTVLVLLGLGAIGAMLGIWFGILAATITASVVLREIPIRWGRRLGGRELHGSVGSFFVVMVLLSLIVNVDIIALELFGPSAVEERTGQYQVVVTISRTPVLLAFTLMTAVFPYLARYGGTSRGSSYASLLMKYTLLFIVPLNVIFVVAPASVIDLFFPAEYRTSSVALMVAGVGSGTLSVGYTLVTLLLGSRRLLTIAVLAAALSLELAAVAVLAPLYAGVGAAASLCTAGFVIVSALAVPATAAHGISPSVRGALAYVAAVAIFAVSLLAIPHGSAITTLLALIGGSIVYTLSVVFLGLVRGDDVRRIGAGLGPRGAFITRRLELLVDRANLLRPARAPEP